MKKTQMIMEKYIFHCYQKWSFRFIKICSTQQDYNPLDSEDVLIIYSFTLKYLILLQEKLQTIICLFCYQYYKSCRSFKDLFISNFKCTCTFIYMFIYWKICSHWTWKPYYEVGGHILSPLMYKQGWSGCNWFGLNCGWLKLKYKKYLPFKAIKIINHNVSLISNYALNCFFSFLLLVLKVIINLCWNK